MLIKLDITDSRTWIGGTRLGSDNVFYWFGHAKEIAFTNWDSEEPNNERGNEECISPFYSPSYNSTGFWFDDPCDWPCPFICEHY